MGILDTFKRKTDGQPGEKPAVKSVAKKTEDKPVEKKAAKPAPVKKTAEFSGLRQSGILVKPAMTEKSFALQALNKYVFYVTIEANKNQVRMAVKETYGTEPVSVQMIKRHAQTLYRWGKETGTRKAYKKAIVTMPKGTSLPLTSSK
ncbi:MAG: 50S ribosomal protein L23 [Parcubacteria group bacterium]|nr:50S ribosomal protein L23 [Parcubacteria group bacterium]